MTSVADTVRSPGVQRRRRQVSSQQMTKKKKKRTGMSLSCEATELPTWDNLSSVAAPEAPQAQ